MKVAARRIIKKDGTEYHHILIKIVRQNPGVHFRELSRASGLSIGTLVHQLALLERLGLMRANRSGGFTRYYNSGVSKTEMELLNLLRQRTCREIIGLLLLERDIQKVAHFLHSKKLCK